MSEWKQLTATATVQAHRTGWRGTWGAIKAAITRKPRLTVPQEVTVSVWVNAPEGHQVQLNIIKAVMVGQEPKP